MRHKSYLNNTELFISKFNEGDIDAFEFVFKTNYGSLSYYAFKLTSNKMVAEDIVQNVFIRLWKNKNQFNSLTALKSFLYISVRNGCLDENKKSTHSFNLREKVYDNFEPLPEEALSEILNAETLGILYNSIRNLPYVCRKVMMMSLSGKKNSEIAFLLNISINTVRAHKQKAITKLKKILPSDIIVLLIITTSLELQTFSDKELSNI